MPSVATKKHTYDDYARLPEGSSYQLIDGDLIMTPAPNIAHQTVAIRLGSELHLFVSHQALGKVLTAPTDVYFSETNTFQPDILFIAKGRLDIIKESRIEGAPDLVIEILSPTTGYYDLIHKKNIYESSGVKEYWLVDPVEKTIEVLGNSRDGFVLHTRAKGEGTVTSNLIAGFSVDIHKLFADI
jgi:Uma2 family endonuclease